MVLLIISTGLAGSLQCRLFGFSYQNEGKIGEIIEIFIIGNNIATRR
jgi:hypothetical protein